MAQSRLLVHPARVADGVGHHITPESAGWRYVGFETRTLKQGAKSELDTGVKEVCVVILSGKARVTAKGFDSGLIGERASAAGHEPPQRACPVSSRSCTGGFEWAMKASMSRSDWMIVPMW